MASTDVLQQVEDRQVARRGRSTALGLLLAEYRRAVAAEAFYEELRRGGAGSRSEIARAVFEQLYSAGIDSSRWSR
jgi:hypothetical protein